MGDDSLLARFVVGVATMRKPNIGRHDRRFVIGDGTSFLQITEQHIFRVFRLHTDMFHDLRSIMCFAIQHHVHKNFLIASTDFETFHRLFLRGFVVRTEDGIGVCLCTPCVSETDAVLVVVNQALKEEKKRREYMEGEMKSEL